VELQYFADFLHRQDFLIECHRVYDAHCSLTIGTRQSVVILGLRRLRAKFGCCPICKFSMRLS
jgi:hypothetical protein